MDPPHILAVLKTRTKVAKRPEAEAANKTNATQIDIQFGHGYCLLVVAFSLGGGMDGGQCTGCYSR